MSHPARLSLRAPPHLPFVQGWPGIPTSPQRKVASVQGTVEVRIGPQPIKARWVRAEIRKYESAPPGFPSSSSNETWEHVGEISTLWAAPEGKEWDNLEQADFKFFIPLPDDLPPSVDMAKGTGVRYELVAALCYRQKGGVFKKEAAPIMKVSEPIRITRHDVHSAWPIYNIADAREIKSSSGDLTLLVQRPGSGFGPTDRILFTATLKSMRPKPFKLKGFECSLLEITTVTPQLEQGSKGGKKGKGPPPPVTKSRVLASARHAVDESIGRGGEKSARMDLPVPAEKLQVTLTHAKSIAVRYELEVKAVCDGGVPDIGMGKIPYTVGPFARAHAQQAVRDIGHVDSLCPGIPRPSLGPSMPSSMPSSDPSSRQPSLGPGQFPPQTPSPQPPFPPNGFYPNGTRAVSQPVPGFTPRNNFRRKSSGTSTMTTTTTTTFDQNAHNQLNGRPQSMQPRSNVAFPMPSPAPGLQRAQTGRTMEPDFANTIPPSPNDSTDDRSRFTQSDIGHGDLSNRYSTGTMATFGRWDKDLRMAMAKGDGSSPVTPSSAGLAPNPSLSPGPPHPSAQSGSRPRIPPSAWQSAEQEKAKLYDDARNRAAAAQYATGASLATLGLEDADTAPPEYAPPRPKMPAAEYKAPEQPLSAYDPKALGSGSGIPSGSASGSGSGSGFGVDNGGAQTPKPTESKELVQAYQTATQEKEQQRQRFDEAQKRMVSGSPSAMTPRGSTIAQEPPSEAPVPYDQIFPAASSSSSAGPSSSNAQATPPRLPVPNTAGPSGVSEKEQMRRFYEAQDRVARAAGQSQSQAQSPEISPPGSHSGHGGVPLAPPLAGAVAVPALSEKEQMRRYYEAQDRVAQAGGQAGGQASGSGGGLTEDSPARAAPSAVSAAGQGTGLSEKEQMRRFYEAQDRVARAGQSQDGHGHSRAISTDGSPSSSRIGGQAQPGPSQTTASPIRPPVPGATGLGISGGPPTSGLSEKEQMRRFYEAQDRVARAGQQSNEGHSRAPSMDVSPNPSRFSPSAPTARSPTTARSPPPPAPGPGGIGSFGIVGAAAAVPSSGLNEKEQMRRFYEAQDRVARAAGGGEGQSPGLIQMDDAPAYDAPSGSGQTGSSNDGPSSSGLPSNPSPQTSGRAFPSAEEEKAQMQNRFNLAQAAVERQKAGQETSTRPMTPVSPGSPVIGRDPTIKAGKAKARVSNGSTTGTGSMGGGMAPAPPPLPVKPPREYIDLLSPVGPGASFARMGMGANGGASASGSGSASASGQGGAGSEGK